MLKVTFKSPRHRGQEFGDPTHPPLVIESVVRVVRRNRVVRLVFADNIAAVRACLFIGGDPFNVEGNEVVVYTDLAGGYELRHMHFDECEVADLLHDRIC